MTSSSSVSSEVDSSSSSEGVKLHSEELSRLDFAGLLRRDADGAGGAGIHSKYSQFHS